MLYSGTSGDGFLPKRENVRREPARPNCRFRTDLQERCPQTATERGPRPVRSRSAVVLFPARAHNEGIDFRSPMRRAFAAGPGHRSAVACGQRPSPRRATSCAYPIGPDGPALESRPSRWENLDGGHSSRIALEVACRKQLDTADDLVRPVHAADLGVLAVPPGVQSELGINGWGAWIRTRDDGTKNRCLTAWRRPNRAFGGNRLLKSTPD